MEILTFGSSVFNKFKHLEESTPPFHEALHVLITPCINNKPLTEFHHRIDSFNELFNAARSILQKGITGFDAIWMNFPIQHI